MGKARILSFTADKSFKTSEYVTKLKLIKRHFRKQGLKEREALGKKVRYSESMGVFFPRESHVSLSFH